MKNKNYLSHGIPTIWQILKNFSGHFCQAQILKLFKSLIISFLIYIPICISLFSVSLSSVLIHLTVNQQKISHWNLIFWKACIQVVFSLPFLCQNRQRHPLNFSQKSVPIISVRYYKL